MNGRKISVKKSGSLESSSDQSISNEMLATKDTKQGPRSQVNAPGSRGIPKRTALSRTDDTIKTGMNKMKPPTVRKAQERKVSTVNKATKLPNNNNANSALSRLPSPQVKTEKGSIRKPSASKESPRKVSSAKSDGSPAWKLPSANSGIGKPAPMNRQGRTTLKKPKKMFNPPSLFNLCKDALVPLISPPEVPEDTKDFLKRRVYSQALLGTIWSTLTTQTKESRITTETLIQERDTLRRDLAELQNTLDSQISTLRKQHEDILSTTTTTLVSQHLTQTQQLTETYESTVSDLRSQLAGIDEVHRNEITRIRDEHCNEIATLHSQHEEQQNQLIATHKDTVAGLEATQHDLEEQNEYLDSQLREKDETMQAEIAAQVQKEVARYATINAELQSLRDVIDMRNAEVKRQQSRIAELQLKADEVAAYKHEVQGLRDQNEQLRATIEVKTDTERTLNQTQESLYQTIREKETESKSMELKCDELRFKLSLMEETRNNMPSSPLHFSTPTGGVNPLTSPFRADIKGMSQVRLFDDIDTQSTPILPVTE